MRQTDRATPREPLRLWPGVLAAVLLVLATLVAALGRDLLPLGMMGAVGASVLIVVWWAFFSRAPWPDRLGALVLMAVAVLATRRFLHPSIAGAGRGMLFYFLAIPVLSFALVAWAMASRHLGSGPRLVSMAATLLLSGGGFTLLRSSGVTGDAPVDLHWRWTPTPEERLLAREPVALPSAPQAEQTHESAPTPPAQPGDAAKATTPAATAAKPSAKRPVARAAGEPEAVPAVPTARETRAAPWPGFRGPGRDGVVRGVRIETDWAAAPPVELWRRPIGPGWSSFAVGAGLLYTQEQRGDDEIVSCYRLSSGEPVWRHRDAARFWEANAGPGPRGTPTLGNGRVYTLGATGIVNALDARDGSVVWSRNAAADTETKLPYWGFTSSPLVVGDVVIVAASGALVAYDIASGDLRWRSPSRGGSYSSPHLSAVDGTAQVILLRGSGAHSVAPADGTLLWEHAWPPGGAIVQPALTPDGHVLISTNDTSGGVGIRRLAVARGSGGWSVEERWTSRGLKPYYNDLVVHEGHAFGFDGSILACIDLGDGTRKWKGGRFGHGQLVLLPDQDVLLVLSEEGELALVGATPDRFTELARVKAIEGKTWNHPALAGDVLLVRNGEEMAAFRLALAGPDGGH
jgi:hypothetical protein